ncbi:MAG: FGGY-family carbohydrate kinase [Sandaracinaceae bacterium]|nr:FGGY-family carbohydrate kinase [Sandaracinaceae bacterium]
MSDEEVSSTIGELYLGVDVGTGSARAALFDGLGTRHGLGVAPFPTWRPETDFVEQSSDAIWQACGDAIRAALADASAMAEQVAGVGFDATCSLVALDARGRPVTVSPTGDDRQNVIVWMDHRATEQAARITATKHDVLRSVGGTMSPEMEPPKLLWLKERLPASWARAARFYDLPDFLVHRATGNDVRSLCTTVCKWTYRGDEGRWDDSFFEAIGLGDLVGYDKIGARVRPMGEHAGGLTEAAARELGLAAGTPVGVAIIDAHAGGLGLLGAADGPLDDAAFDARLALIGGTSSCHMAVSAAPRFIEGVWGPYPSAMVPGKWLTEGGQSATGALIDHVITSHARAAELETEARREGVSVHALLERRLDALAADLAFPAELTRELHVYPDFHGNRSPRADASLRGMVSGLALDASVDALALLYLATVQAIAHGTRHIVDALNGAGYRIDTMIACGGDTKSPLFVREHADATGCRVVLPREPEAVLLGASMLGAVASGAVPSLRAAMASMNAPRTIVAPGGDEVRAYHARKQRILHRMHADQLAYRAL